jgi:hypothetical protein
MRMAISLRLAASNLRMGRFFFTGTNLSGRWSDAKFYILS